MCKNTRFQVLDFCTISRTFFKVLKKLHNHFFPFIVLNRICLKCVIEQFKHYTTIILKIWKFEDILLNFTISTTNSFLTL